MTGCHNRSNDQAGSPYKTMLRKLRYKYQSYCATYRTHAMTTCNGGMRHTGRGRDLNYHLDITTEGDTGGIDIGPNNDDESTNSSACFWRMGGGWLPWQPPDQQPDKTNHTHKRNTQLMTMSGSQRRSASGGIGPHRMGTTESLFCTQGMTDYTPSPIEPFREVICHYMDTLCNTQKQTNLTNSLLQDLTIFSGHDSTKLEYWLMDLETADDLTNEGHAKLAKAKSRGLTCTLIIEAIYSEKTWDEIKDLDSYFVMPVFTCTHHASWIYNSGRTNP